MAALLLALSSLLLTVPASTAHSPRPVRSVAPSVRPSTRVSPSPTVASVDDDEILRNLDFFSFMDAAEHQDLSGLENEEGEQEEDED